MKKNFLTAGLLLFLLLPSCRSTPVSPRGASEPHTEAQKVEPQSNIPAEVEKPSEATPVLPDKPQQERIVRLLPESLITAPAKESASPRIEYNSIINTRPSTLPQNSLWRYRSTRQGQLVGFEFSNHGGNRILTPRRNAVKNQFYTRDFQFRFDERARQDIHLMISDWAPSRDRTFRLSELMNSLLLFFPRTFVPAIVHWNGRNIVTLPTGEEVEFDPATQEVIGGVLSEAPVDLNPDRSSRKFPGVEYTGKGVVIRADSRGADPSMGTTALITTGTPAIDCDKGSACRRCEVKPQELWEQSGAARFKYATDADFDRFLIARCGFGLPRVGPELAVAPTPVPAAR
jgi:hypothetical protein